MSTTPPFTVLLADPTRPAYEAAARAVIEDAEGWRLALPTGFDDDELIALAPTCDVLVTRRRRMPAGFFPAAARLRAVLHLGSRAESTVVAAAEERGVPVEASATRGTLAVAEHAMALMLACSRQIVAGHQAVVSGAYRERGLAPRATNEVEHGFQWMGLEGVSLLAGATLGLVGCGEIGQAVAGMARAFGMRVQYYRRTPLDAELERALGVRYAPLDELLASSQVVSLHLPHAAQTERLLDERRLRMLPRGAIVVNTARGGLIDEAALVRALSDGHIAAAGLDVFADEPLPADHPLTRAPNVVLTPHVGAAPARGLQEMLEQLVPRLRQLAHLQ